MLTVQVPTFDEFNKYEFMGFVNVKIKNKPDWQDVKKVCKPLPGIPQGGIGKEPLKDLLSNGKKDVRDFYDARQRTKKLKGFFLMLKKG